MKTLAVIAHVIVSPAPLYAPSLVNPGVGEQIDRQQFRRLYEVHRIRYCGDFDHRDRSRR